MKMKAYIQTAIHYCSDHIKEMSGYFTLGIVGYKVWEDAILPILVAAVCAAVGATIQHFVKKYWAKKEGHLPKYRQNGKH